jgi:tetrahydromethanopterin S-methyltransferase subunit H
MSDYITVQNGNDIIKINKDKFSGLFSKNSNEDIISLAYEDDNGVPKVVQIYKDKDPAAFAEALDFLQSLK